MDVAALLLGRQVVDSFLLLRRAERAEREDLRLAAREQRGAVRRGEIPTSVADRPDLLVPRQERRLSTAIFFRTSPCRSRPRL